MLDREIVEHLHRNSLAYGEHTQALMRAGDVELPRVLTWEHDGADHAASDLLGAVLGSDAVLSLGSYAPGEIEGLVPGLVWEDGAAFELELCIVFDLPADAEAAEDSREIRGDIVASILDRFRRPSRFRAVLDEHRCWKGRSTGKVWVQPEVVLRLRCVMDKMGRLHAGKYS